MDCQKQEPQKEQTKRHFQRLTEATPDPCLSVSKRAKTIDLSRFCVFWKLLEEIPYLTDAKQGKERVLMSKEDIGDSVKKALSDDSDTVAKF